MKCRVLGWAAKVLTSTALTLALAVVIGAFAITTRQTAAQDAGAVSLHDNFFDPTTIDVAVGSTVVWTNAGQGQHTVVSDDGVFDSGQDKSQWLNPGQTFSATFTQAGTYPFHCALHGAAGGVGMSGTVIVESASPASTTAAPQTEPPPTANPTLTVTPAPAPATPPPATVTVIPAVRSTPTGVTPTTSVKPPAGTNPDPSGSGNNDIVWILLVLGGAGLALGAVAAVLYRTRSRRTP